MSNNNSKKLPLSTAEQREAAAKNAGVKGGYPLPTKYFEASPCEGPGCTNTIPAGMHPIMRTRSFCSDDCRSRDFNITYNQKLGKLPKTSGPLKYFQAIRCQGPACENIVPAGMYSAHRKLRFCSTRCRRHYVDTKFVVGTCLCGCGQPVLGGKRLAKKPKFVNQAHYRTYRRERLFEGTGCFRPLIERYVDGPAKVGYRGKGSRVMVQGSLVKLCRVAVKEAFTDVNQIRSATIVDLINIEDARGTSSRYYLPFISTWFNWLIDEELYGHLNPVRPRHYGSAPQREPRPYTDAQLAALWPLVEASGKHELMLAFWIGLECGLRVSEVCNIRLLDIDPCAQTISVRLPTKNGCTRTVPFHDKVKHHHALWLARRSPYCATDHLLHNKADLCFNSSSMDQWFQKVFQSHGEPAASFSFHALRHTWATRLMNNGMELAVLMELGGWKSLSACQGYFNLLPATVRRVYEATYKTLQEKEASWEDESLSLLDLAAMVNVNPVTSLEPAA